MREALRGVKGVEVGKKRIAIIDEVQITSSTNDNSPFLIS